MAHSQATQSKLMEVRMAEARRGKADAFYDLGIMYSIGKGVPVDLIEAHKWLNLAAMKGLREAQACRAELAAEMSPLEVAEAQRMAREWMQTQAH